MQEAPPTDAEISAAERRKKSRRAETVAVVLVSLAGLTTSWSTYQAARWSGDQSAQYVAAMGSHMEAARLSIEAGQLQQVDLDAFIGFITAYRGGRDDEAQFWRARMRAEFRPALEAWLASAPLNNPTAAPTPFALPEYHVELRDEAARRTAEAQERFASGQRANDVGDSYVLVSVVLATVMFLSGISQPLHVHRLKVALLALAAVLMVYGLYNVAVLPTQ